MYDFMIYNEYNQVLLDTLLLIMIQDWLCWDKNNIYI